MTSNISTHAPHAGSDSAIAASMSAFAFDFNPRSPCGERPRWTRCAGCGWNFNPRSPAGIDEASWLPIAPHNNFNPSSPCGERPGGYDRKLTFGDVFQSALPLRGATQPSGTRASLSVISIRAPLAGSDLQRRYGSRPGGISIRAPLAGSDTDKIASWNNSSLFQSALPLRGATNDANGNIAPDKFQSALPLRGATVLTVKPLPFKLFQSALPLRGATGSRRCSRSRRCNFNPRSPCGERRCRWSGTWC